jgi:type II secretory pathway component PulK
VRRRRTGYILIEALIAVAGLLALLAILASDQQTRIDLIQSGLRQTRAEACADGAVQQALSVLATANPDLVTLNDTWAQLGGTSGVATSSTSGTTSSGGTEEFSFPDGSTFREQIIDADSLINLNNATATQMEQLPLDQDQVDCFLDWIQAGETPRSDGAKDDFYNALPTPYNAKLGPLTTVSELCLIDNWTAQTLYQPPTDSTVLPLSTDISGNILPLAALFTVDSGAPNVTSTGTALINLSNRPTAANAVTLIRAGVSPGIVARLMSTAPGNPPINSWMALLSLPGVNSSQEQILLNNVTFTSATRLTGTINLNTASLPVLESIPLVTQSIAEAIVGQQSTTFSGLGSLAAIAGLSRADLATLASTFCVGSDTWIVRAYGQSGGVGSAEEAVVGYRNNQLQIISINRIHTPGIPSWWGWDTTTTSTQQAGVTQ